MSRYTIPAYETRYHVVVGWDAPLATFFGEVWNRTVPDEHDETACVLWAGAALGALPTVDALQACLQAYATIPAAVGAQLQQDCAHTSPRSPLQERLLQLLTPRVDRHRLVPHDRPYTIDEGGRELTATWHMMVTGLQALARCPRHLAWREETIWALDALAAWLAAGGAPTNLTPEEG